MKQTYLGQPTSSWRGVRGAGWTWEADLLDADGDPTGRLVRRQSPDRGFATIVEVDAAGTPLPGATFETETWWVPLEPLHFQTPIKHDPAWDQAAPRGAAHLLAQFLQVTGERVSVDAAREVERERRYAADQLKADAEAGEPFCLESGFTVRHCKTWLCDCFRPDPSAGEAAR